MPAHRQLFSEGIPLADKNWFKTGGNARYFAQPETAHQMAQALQFAKESQLSLFVLGSGANILISDDGFDGLVIRPQLSTIVHSDQLVTAGAGVSLATLIKYCLDHNLQGLEEFSGIPGTVGGAVYINLHYFEFLLSQFLVQATIISKQTGEIQTVDNAWFGFGYNSSRLHEKKHILIDATFQLKSVDKNKVWYAKGRADEIIRHRSHRYPHAGTCGSFFRNFNAQEVTLESVGKKVIWVAYYLDKIGIKGMLQVGDAQVSYQHANMIVNRGSATSSDIIAVARQMQQMVYAEFGSMPQPECQLIGFKKYPLMQVASDPSTSSGRTE